MLYRIIALLFLTSVTLINAQDTLNIVTYNVLNYGDDCQGGNSTLHSYLKTITAYTKPDIFGMVKMTSIKINASDNNGILPIGFADSVINNALNPAISTKSFGYCSFTNLSGDSKTSVLFYNKNKLGFISTISLSTYISDFNLYKLYYKDPALVITRDTTFLYVVLNHTQSGDDPTARNQQEAQVLQAIENRFSKLPNMLIMGDFNIHNSSEQFYQNYVSATDTNFRLYDTPFAIDKKLSYPIDWDNNPSACPAYLTTSTRQSASIPNTCGTDGGAKSWYDHILISPWIKSKTNYISYVPNSYQTIGNDGSRIGISINDSSAIKNNSAPSGVINALFQLSNKYPVSLKLALHQNTTGQSPADPDKSFTITGLPESMEFGSIKVVNPVTDNYIRVYFPPKYNGQIFTAIISDQTGRIVSEEMILARETVEIAFRYPQGLYHLTILIKNEQPYHQKILKL